MASRARRWHDAGGGLLTVRIRMQTSRRPSWASPRRRTARSQERALLCYARDLLALKVAQDLCFFLGNRLDLRDVAARVLPAWPPEQPPRPARRAITTT